MRVVVFEDNDAKWQVIRECLLSKGLKDTSVKRIDNVAQFVEIANLPVDLCIIDILMPGVSGGATRSAGTELLQMMDFAGMQRVPVLAITAYPDEASQLRDQFLTRGCIVYDYSDRSTWSQALDIFIAQSKEKGRYDFLLFTALKKERDAFLSFSDFSIDSTQRSGFDIWEIELGSHPGAIVLLPRMGIVNAAITVARALEVYSPSVVAMSGICAGFEKNAELGQLLVADIVWEYQSGKWANEVFEAEPYQVSIKPETRLLLAKILEREGLLPDLESHFTGKVRPSLRSQPRFAPFTTGSAVIASERRLATVAQQHRKVAGLDMELFGFHRAVELCGRNVSAFSAKVVVDTASESKGDELHEYGCIVSAAFVVDALRHMISKLPGR